MDAELYKPFNLCFRIFKALGMWQDRQQPWRYVILGVLLHIVVIELYIIGQILYLWNEENFVNCAKAIAPFLVFLVLFLKSINFITKIKKIIQSVENLKELLNFTQLSPLARREIIKRRVRSVHKIHKFFWSFATFGCICGVFATIASHKMLSPMWYPFDTENSEIGFWAASLYMVTTPFIGTTLTVAWEVFPVAFLSFAVGLIEELTERLKDVKDSDDLIKCIEIHLKIKDFVKEIQDNFAFVEFFQALLSSTSICVGAFSLTTVS